MLPADGLMTPEMVLSSVVLPAPFAPTRATNSPSFTSRDRSQKTCTFP